MNKKLLIISLLLLLSIIGFTIAKNKKEKFELISSIFPKEGIISIYVDNSN